MNFVCPECGQDAGTSLVCRECIPKLSGYKHQKYMHVMHKIIIERDGNTCRLCGHSATTDSGELGCNHNPTQGSRPDLVFDVTLHECACMNCNGKHSYSAPIEVKKAVAKPKFKKPAVCAVMGCPIFAAGEGFKKPAKCYKHQ